MKKAMQNVMRVAGRELGFHKTAQTAEQVAIRS
jgi:hypothetical protein